MRKKVVSQEFTKPRQHRLNLLGYFLEVLDPDETYWKCNRKLIIINKNNEDLSFACQCEDPFFRVIEKKSSDELMQEGFARISFEEVWRLIVAWEIESNDPDKLSINEFLLQWERYFH